MRAIYSIAATVASLLVFPAAPATCNVSATGIVLGSYTPNQAGPADSAGSISITCIKSALEILPLTVNYSLSISRGGSSSFSPREMASGANTVHYNLYRDSSRLSIWGDSTGGTVAVSGALLLVAPTGNTSSTHTVYGRIFGGQNAVPGVYADAIIISVSY